MLLPGPTSEAASSLVLTVDATRRSSTTAPAKPPPLPFRLGVPAVTSDPALPSTAEIRERVSKLPTMSRNSVLVSGWRMFSRLHNAVYASKRDLIVGAVLWFLDGVDRTLSEAEARFFVSRAEREQRTAFCWRFRV